MRRVGSVDDKQLADRFVSYLYAEEMNAEVRDGASDTFDIWIHNHKHLERAREAFELFQAQPDARQFTQGVRKAKGRRKDASRQAAQWQSRLDRARRIQDSEHNPGVPPITAGLLAGSMLAAAGSHMGQASPMLELLMFSSPGMPPLYDISHGQIWRLLTPIFVHLGWLHLIFNMSVLVWLGPTIERRRGSLGFLVLVVLLAISSNLGQVAWELGRANFGGMSGVIYGFIGYLWWKGRSDPTDQLELSSGFFYFALVWMGLGMLHIIGPIANGAHLVGLLSGISLAWLSPHVGRRL